MNVVYTFVGIVGIFLVMLAIRALFYWLGGVYGNADRYWYLDWEKPDVPEVTRDNITEICHRLRIPPPSKL